MDKLKTTCFPHILTLQMAMGTIIYVPSCNFTELPWICTSRFCALFFIVAPTHYLHSRISVQVSSRQEGAEDQNSPKQLCT